MIADYTRQAIVKNKLCIVTQGGSIATLGIRTIRAAIKQIESSECELRPSTVAALSLYRYAVALWDARNQR